MSSQLQGDAAEVRQPVKKPSEVAFPWGREEEEEEGKGMSGVRQGREDPSSAISRLCDRGIS